MRSKRSRFPPRGILRVRRPLLLLLCVVVIGGRPEGGGRLKVRQADDGAAVESGVDGAEAQYLCFAAAGGGARGGLDARRRFTLETFSSSVSDAYLVQIRFAGGKFRLCCNKDAGPQGRKATATTQGKQLKLLQ